MAMEAAVRVAGPENVLELAVGEWITFGRDEDQDLVISDDPRVHRRVGSIGNTGSNWTVDNEGRWLVVELRRLDGSGHDTVEPGGTATVSWARTRLSVTLPDGLVASVEVCRLEDSDDRNAVSSLPHPVFGDTVGVDLEPSTGYFRALLALAEPRLMDPIDGQLPTNAQVALRLNKSGLEFRRVTAKTVERRLDYCRTRLGLKNENSAYSQEASTRRVLVDVAIAAGVVSRSQLKVLVAANPEMHDDKDET